MNIEARGKIYHNEYQGKQYLNISDSSKNVDGTYTNKYWRCRFKKDSQIPTHESIINYKGFMTYFATEKDGKKVVYETIMITDWEYQEQAQPKDDYDYVDYGVKTEADDPFADSKKIDVQEQDLPF